MIKEISCINLSSPYGDGKTFGNQSGLKSISVIEVIDDDGIVGYGEAYPGIYAPTIVKNYIDLISNDIIGIPTDNLEAFDKATNKHCVSMSGIARSVIGSVEIAIFDILAQKKKVPLYQLLRESDAHSDKIKCYYSGGLVMFSPEEVAADAQRAIEAGHDAFKMRVGYRPDDIDRATAAKKVLGANPLMCDAIQCTLRSWDVDEAIEQLKKMEDLQLYWAEEFVDPSNPAAVSKLGANSDTYLAFGESFTTLAEFKVLCGLHCLDVAQPDVTQCGGIRAAKDICNHVNSAIIAFHIWGGPVSIAANLHTALALQDDLKDIWVEIPSVSLQLTNDLLKLDICDGHVRFDCSSGLGVQINSTIKDKYRFSNSSSFKG